MPYVDYGYYTESYRGVAIEEGQFNSLVVKASDAIDMVTSDALQGIELSQQPIFLQEKVKKATAAQVEYMAMNGGETAMHGGSPSSVNVGNFSYSESEGMGSQRVSPAVMDYLRPTGLLYRGVSVRDY